MSNRTAFQLQARIVKPGAIPRIHGNVIKGSVGDDFGVGAFLTLNQGGRAATLPTTISSTTTSPVRYIALAAYDGVSSTEYVALEEINADTIIEAQISTGKATTADIGKRGTVVQDATSGKYCFTITASNPSAEIVDVEAGFSVDPKADGNYNLVWFKFLPAVLEVAPQAAS